MTKATPESSDSLVFECDLDEPPEKVWRALTEPRLLEAWLTTGDALSANAADLANGANATDVVTRARGPGEVDRPNGAGGVDEAQERPPSSEPQLLPRRARDLHVLTAEPHRLLRYRWRDREDGAGDSGAREMDSVVTFELAPDSTGGTHLRLTHGEFRIAPVAQPATLARVRPIAMRVASTRRRKTPRLSFAAQFPLRRAA